MSYQNRASGLLSDYMNVRTIPAALSVAFVVASLYQFGGISQVHLPWVGYTLDTSHAMLISLATYGVAFASSETKQFEHYETEEQALIAAGPTLIVGHQYVPQVSDLLVQIGDPLGYQIAFGVTAVSWAVMSR